MGTSPSDKMENARKKKGWTQSEVAKKLDITLRQYQKYVAGNFPKFKNDAVKKIDALLGTNIYELIYEQSVHETHETTESLPDIIGDIKERLLQAEARLEVYENTIATLLSNDKSDVPDKINELRERVNRVVNRRFDELSKKR